MTQLRVGLAQLNPTVGDLTGNAALIRQSTATATQQDADIVVCPALALTGAPLQELATRTAFVSDARDTLTRLASELAEDGNGGILVVLGYLDRDDTGPRNAVAALHGGEVVTTRFARHPTAAFDEDHSRHTDQQLGLLQLHGVAIAMLHGADVAAAPDAVTTLRNAGAGVVLSPHAAPFPRNAGDQPSAELVPTGLPICYANLVGAADDLVFDGSSCIVGSDGTVLAQAPQFATQLVISDITLDTERLVATEETPAPQLQQHHLETARRQERVRITTPGIATPERGPTLSNEAQTWSALVLGLRDYARKNGFHSVLFGFSGGIDSAVCAALATDALGADAVHGVSMPSRYSSQHSREDAAELARRLGCRFRTENVEDIVDSYVTRLELTGLAEENIQARVRGMLLMAISNTSGQLVLAPGNKTELAVGYSTLYGDAVGGFAPLKDVFKTQVWRLARWRNDEASGRSEIPPIPERSISKPASAELRPDQADTDSLPEYNLLDDLLQQYIEQDRDRSELVASGFDPTIVDRILRMVNGSEYKRRQYPQGTRVSRRSFDRDRRFPVTNAWHETH